jgi:hypothetical protein
MQQTERKTQTPGIDSDHGGCAVHGGGTLRDRNRCQWCATNSGVCSAAMESMMIENGL